MAEQFFIENRKAFFEKMEDNAVSVFFAGQSPYKGGDEKYPFAPNRNFYYLTGLPNEKVVLFLAKVKGNQTTILYVERDNGPIARWVGKNLSPEESKEQTGITDIRYLDDLQEDTAGFLFKYLVQTMYLDLERRDFSAPLSESLLFAEHFGKRFPSLFIKNSYPILGELREIKKPYELALMQKAIDITADGIYAMMQHAKAGMMEYEIEAAFEYVLKKAGVKEKAFQTIGAAGKNGTILHYGKNDGKTKDGDLILFDCGAQTGYYNGDLTRTFPVNGTFTERQKQVYEIVLRGQEKIIAAIKPGVPFSSLNELLREYYFIELKKIGLVKEKEDVSEYYFHNVSHYLGLETHDIGRYQERELVPGMVLTVEPGLYIEEWEIGIRIEDDVLVTEDGRKVLSANMIKTVAEIETFMKKGALV